VTCVVSCTCEAVENIRKYHEEDFVIKFLSGLKNAVDKSLNYIVSAGNKIIEGSHIPTIFEGNLMCFLLLYM